MCRAWLYPEGARELEDMFEVEFGRATLRVAYTFIFQEVCGQCAPAGKVERAGEFLGRTQPRNIADTSTTSRLSLTRWMKCSVW